MEATAFQPTYSHVVETDGVAYIAETTMKVVELVMAQRAHGWSPEELHFQFPHLSMGQVHAALTYYWDHQKELDADIERRSKLVDRERDAWAGSPATQKLRRAKFAR